MVYFISILNFLKTKFQGHKLSLDFTIMFFVFFNLKEPLIEFVLFNFNVNAADMKQYHRNAKNANKTGWLKYVNKI